MKGEIMGIEKLSGAQLYDIYAEEFRKKSDNSNYATRSTTTVPIVENKKDLGKGVTLEHADEDTKAEPRNTAEQSKGRTLENKDNFNAAVKETQEKIEAQGTKFETGRVTLYTNKKEYKQAKKEYKQALKTKEQEYVNQGYDKKIAKQKAKEEIPEVRYRSSKDLAKDIVENDRNKQRFEATTVFIDKDAYKEAQKQNELKQQELVEQYTANGMSKKDAKKRAESELPLNSYVNNKNTKKFINAQKEAFYDEQGNFSSDKFKQSSLCFANLHTGKDEDVNYHLSLKERREGAALYNANPDKKIKIKNDVISDLAHKSNLGWEKDHTRAIRAAVIGGSAVVGGVAGAILSPSAVAGAAAGAAADATAGGATAGAVATGAALAKASVDLTAVGIGVGAVAGGAGAGFLADKGGTEPVIPKLDKNTPVPEPQPEDEVEEEPERCILQPNEQTFDDFTDEETCSYTLKKGKNGKYETLYDAVRDGYGLKDHKEIMKYVHVIKDKYKIPYNVIPTRTTWEMPEIDGRKFNCDVNVKATGHRQAGKKKVKTFKDNGFNANQVNNPFTKYWYEDCSGNRSDMYDDAETRNKKMAEKQAEIDAQ